MTKTPSKFPFPPKRLYSGAKVPMRVIRRYARAIAEQFHPEKIVLFGSHAYGTPHEDSDVDLLVVMPARSAGRWPPFPMDLIVRTPERCVGAWRKGTCSTRKSCRKGKSSMKKATREWVRKAEADFRGAGKLARTKPPVHDLVCFHCQQCAEKHLKALLEELGVPVSKTHNLDQLLNVLRPHHPGLVFLAKRMPGNAR